MTVVDVDTTDVVDTSVTGVAVSGNQGTLTEAQLLAMLTLTGDDDLAANSDDTNNLGWDFSSNPEAFDFLAADQTLTLTYTLTSTDNHGASDTQTVTITITGTNDAAVIAAVAGGDYAVVEAGGVANGTPGDPDAMGQLTVSDVDDGEDHFEVPASLAGTYGNFTFDEATGAWTYTLDNSLAVTEGLDAGDPATDTLTVYSHDGTSYDIVVNITGANDAPVSGGVDSASGSEDDASITGNVPAASDVDGDTLTYQLVAGSVEVDGVPAGDGTVTFNADGSYSYDPSGDQDLDDGDTRTITFSYVANDGDADSAPATVTITVNGANDAPVSGGVDSASGSEDDASITGNVPAASDVDGDTLTYQLVTGSVEVDGVPRATGR